jgi:hypothetical protein
MLCSDLVHIQWEDKSGRLRQVVATLEDISISGACIQVEQPIPLYTALRILHAKRELQGCVCYRVYREVGYFVGIEFSPGYRWSVRQFRPLHLMDVRRLVNSRSPRALK